MLPALLNQPKGQSDWDRWSFDNRVAHNQARAAIAARGGPRLADHQLDPISPQDAAGWLQRHAMAHAEIDRALGIQSADLMDVDLTDENQLSSWIWIHHLEHNSMARALGL
jgi:hypothetical protein